VLVALYQIRNNRGVGDVGGDVDANQMDASYVLHSVHWVMAELVRILHQTDVKTTFDTVGVPIEATTSAALHDLFSVSAVLAFAAACFVLAGGAGWRWAI
jgi:hypothetical protein